ncbi:MAG: hypothetical protein K8S00_05725 [Bacteroidales bacterium]|nr:hypothetical protein [Bacteroidales bacterium]
MTPTIIITSDPIRQVSMLINGNREIPGTNTRCLLPIIRPPIQSPLLGVKVPWPNVQGLRLLNLAKTRNEKILPQKIKLIKTKTKVNINGEAMLVF